MLKTMEDEETSAHICSVIMLASNIKKATPANATKNKSFYPTEIFFSMFQIIRMMIKFCTVITRVSP